MNGAAARPSSGARYVLERAVGLEQDAIVYRGYVHLPEADVPIEVRVSEKTFTAAASVAVEAIPPDGPHPAELERMAAALVRAATKPTGTGLRRAPRKIVRWRG